MRASRLVSILMLLQGRGRLTARQLADELEISIRTIYRDLDGLAASGVPLYGDRGPSGGYSLVDGYRTRLTGLTPAEAEAIFLAGLHGPAQALGLGSNLAAAEQKLMAALPAELRPQASRVSERFHLDPSTWFTDMDEPAHLLALAESVWEQRRLRVRYRRWQGEVMRTLEPLGIVLKGGSWYVVATADAQIRTYRAARILDIERLPERFERPPGFNLAAFWETWAQEFESRMHQLRARVRASPRGLAMMEHLFGSARMRTVRESQCPADAYGWVEVSVPLESMEYGYADLLPLGADIEVLGPPELRERIAMIVEAMQALYRPATKAPD
ncbi:MAG TPA: YafY family protein [Chloroflexota bacterium]|nr:YafY family protein [Chloroflexota bacterium]